MLLRSCADHKRSRCSATTAEDEFSHCFCEGLLSVLAFPHPVQTPGASGTCSASGHAAGVKAVGLFGCFRPWSDSGGLRFRLPAIALHVETPTLRLRLIEHVVLWPKAFLNCRQPKFREVQSLGLRRPALKLLFAAGK